jgi:hypothetical protein
MHPWLDQHETAPSTSAADESGVRATFQDLPFQTSESVANGNGLSTLPTATHPLLDQHETLLKPPTPLDGFDVF